MHQTEIALLDQVEQRHAAIQITLGDADDEAQVALYHHLAGLELAFAGQHRIMLLLLHRQKRLHADAVQVVLNGVGRQFGLQQRAEVVLIGFACHFRSVRRRIVLGIGRLFAVGIAHRIDILFGVGGQQQCKRRRRRLQAFGGHAVFTRGLSGTSMVRGLRRSPPLRCWLRFRHGADPG